MVCSAAMRAEIKKWQRMFGPVVVRKPVIKKPLKKLAVKKPLKKPAGKKPLKKPAVKKPVKKK